MSLDIKWSTDGESVTCPACGESWADLWDYEWGNREELHIECNNPECGVTLILVRRVSVDYGVARPTCLCVAEGHKGKQDVGYHGKHRFFKTGLTTCRICDGTGVSPRARQEAEARA